MSEHRRGEFQTRAEMVVAATASLGSAGRSAAGDTSFMYNVPDPHLTDKELPTLKFTEEKSEAEVVGKRSAREATVEEFPIFKGIAGVSMRLEPGAMRELHAPAAEWAYAVAGRVRTPVLGPGGYSDPAVTDRWGVDPIESNQLSVLNSEPTASLKKASEASSPIISPATVYRT